MSAFVGKSCPAPLKTVKQSEGWKIGSFLIQKSLCRSGKDLECEILLALDRKSGCNVIIKRLMKSKLNNLRRLQIQREATIQGSMLSPYVIGMYACFEDLEAIYLIQEPGIIDVFQYCAKNGPMRERDAVRRVLYPMLKGLELIHRRGIIHRDIKPENVILGTNGLAKLADFGLAINTLEEKASTRLGTFEFVAPEVMATGVLKRATDGEPLGEGQEYGTSVDIWSTGVLLFEVLQGTASRLLKGKSGLTTLNFISSVLASSQTFTNEAKDFILACMSLDPLQRPAASALLAHPLVLKHVEPERPVTARPITARPAAAAASTTPAPRSASRPQPPALSSRASSPVPARRGSSPPPPRTPKATQSAAGERKSSGGQLTGPSSPPRRAGTASGAAATAATSPAPASPVPHSSSKTDVAATAPPASVSPRRPLFSARALPSLANLPQAISSRIRATSTRGPASTSGSSSSGAGWTVLGPDGAAAAAPAAAAVYSASAAKPPPSPSGRASGTTSMTGGAGGALSPSLLLAGSRRNSRRSSLDRPHHSSPGAGPSEPIPLGLQHGVRIPQIPEPAAVSLVHDPALTKALSAFDGYPKSHGSHRPSPLSTVSRDMLPQIKQAAASSLPISTPIAATLQSPGTGASSGINSPPSAAPVGHSGRRKMGFQLPAPHATNAANAARGSGGYGPSMSGIARSSSGAGIGTQIGNGAPPQTPPRGPVAALRAAEDPQVQGGRVMSAR